MISSIKRLWRDCRGNTLVIVGAALPLILASAGLATDTIQWTLWKRELQRAADSGALAGVYDRVSTGTTSGTSAVVDHDLTINHHTGIGLVTGYPQVTFPADSGDLEDQVRVVLGVRKSLPFSSMFMTAAPVIIASSTAASVPGADEYCVVALEKNASKTYNEGVVIATAEKDSASKNIMEQIIRESEDSVDWLEAQLDLINRLGIQNYLVTQVGEDEKGGH